MGCCAPLAVLLLGAPAAPPQKAPAEQGAGRRVVTPAGEARVLSAKEARALLAKLSREFRTALARGARGARRGPKTRRRAAAKPDAGLVRRLEAVEELAQVRHDLLPAFLAKVVRYDPSRVVRTKAARALLAQPEKPTRKVVLRLLEAKEVRGTGTIEGPLIRFLDHYGAPAPVWRALRRRFLELGLDGKIALLESIGRRRDWDALDLLLAHLDPPAPKDVDARENPPASYWKRRWEEWRAFKPALQDALEALLGRRFDKAADARHWIDAQGGPARLKRRRR